MTILRSLDPPPEIILRLDRRKVVRKIGELRDEAFFGRGIARERQPTNRRWRVRT